MHSDNPKNSTLSRREMLKNISLATGFVFSAGVSAAFLNGCNTDGSPDWSPQKLSNAEALMVEELCERIIPETDTPGARQAMVHRYIDETLSYLEKEDVEAFKTGLKNIDNLCREKYKKSFVKLTDIHKDDIMNKLATAWKESGDNRHIFKWLRDMTIMGFVTSEAGATKFLNYNPVPGPFEGCVPFSEIGAVWHYG
jgi:gluconate 2-dehydrogenase gamma chain